MNKNLKQQKALETKNRLIDSALKVFSRKGFQSSTTKDIAKEAQITDGLIYHYFSSKEELLWAVIDKHSLNSGLRIVADNSGDPLEDVLEVYFTTMLNMLQEKGDLIVMFFGESQRNPIIHERLIALIQEGVQPLYNFLRTRGVQGEQDLTIAIRNIHTSVVMYFLLIGRTVNDQDEHSQYIRTTVKQFLKIIS